MKRGYQRFLGDMANTISGIVFNAVMALGMYDVDSVDES